jgi:hypothetical protein
MSGRRPNHSSARGESAMTDACSTVGLRPDHLALKPQVLLVFLIGAMAASCHRLDPGTLKPPFTIIGIVESIDGHALTLRHKSGQRVTIRMAPQTTFTAHSRPAAVSDLTTKMRIVVLYRFVDGVPTADEVRLFKDASGRPIPQLVAAPALK